MTFDNAAEHNGWDKKEKLAHLRASLTGVPLELLWYAGEITYDHLVKKLMDRFEAVGMEHRYRNELRCRRRREGGSLRELAQGIGRLMTLAYPGAGDSHIGQHIVMDSFLAALADHDLQVKVRDRDPDTLEEAVKLALRFETTTTAIESSAPSRQRAVRRVDEQSPDTQQVGTEISTAPRQAQTHPIHSPDERFGR